MGEYELTRENKKQAESPAKIKAWDMQEAVIERYFKRYSDQAETKAVREKIMALITKEAITGNMHNVTKQLDIIIEEIKYKAAIRTRDALVAQFAKQPSTMGYWERTYKSGEKETHDGVHEK